MTKAAPSPEWDIAAIAKEQKAFDAALQGMLAEHAGQFVVFHDGKAFGFFPTFRDAYRKGLEKFGLNEVFLVSEVRATTPEPPSISFCTGAMSV